MALHRILLVDDSPLFRALASRTLEEAGYEVMALDPLSVFEVLKACLEFKPHLAIIDYHMPNCNAETLTVILKEDPIFQAMRILGISSSHDPAMVQTMRDCGVDEFVFKGAMDTLTGAVKALL
jgi:CheY-like chemotaxis protein